MPGRRFMTRVSLLPQKESRSLSGTSSLISMNHAIGGAYTKTILQSRWNFPDRYFYLTGPYSSPVLHTNWFNRLFRNRDYGPSRKFPSLEIVL